MKGFAVPIFCAIAGAVISLFSKEQLPNHLNLYTMKVIITIVAIIVIAYVSTLTGAWIRRKNTDF